MCLAKVSANCGVRLCSETIGLKLDQKGGELSVDSLELGFRFNSAIQVVAAPILEIRWRRRSQVVDVVKHVIIPSDQPMYLIPTL